MAQLDAKRDFAPAVWRDRILGGLMTIPNAATNGFDAADGLASASCAASPLIVVPGLKLATLKVTSGLRGPVCEAIKRAIAEMDIYSHTGELWLDERGLSQDLGVSRTPIREAFSLLEQKGLVRSVPRRGVIVVRKTKREIVEMITVWAAIEGMAARMAAPHTTAQDIQGLRAAYTEFQADPSAHLTEYSEGNMAFHRAIIGLAGSSLMTELTDDMFIHMRAVRAVTMGQGNRAQRSVVDHTNIVDALERRDSDLAERLVREHTLGLAAHVEQHGHLLDGPGEPAADPRPRRRARKADQALAIS